MPKNNTSMRSKLGQGYSRAKIALLTNFCQQTFYLWIVKLLTKLDYKLTEQTYLLSFKWIASSLTLDLSKICNTIRLELLKSQPANPLTQLCRATIIVSEHCSTKHLGFHVRLDNSLSHRHDADTFSGLYPFAKAVLGVWRHSVIVMDNTYAVSDFIF